MILTVVASFFLCQVLGNPIIGSRTSPVDTYPWLASIQSGGYHKCGGSIISSTVILTAAHCANYSLESYVVRVGSERTDSGGSWHKVVRIKRHENFNLGDRTVRRDANDVALMKVSPPIKFDTNTTQIQLADKGYNVSLGAGVRVIGWGSTSEEGSPTYELRSAKLHIIDGGECSRAYGDKTGSRITSRHQFCAYGAHTGICHGDAGGPLVNAENIQVGIVFGSFHCADYRYPGAYEAVAYYRDWIDENLSKL